MAAARGGGPRAVVAAPTRRRDVQAAVLLLLLAASIPSFMLIPFHGFWGLDLQNLWAFHACAFRDDPYQATGLACRDAGGRDLVYPPLLYWSFVWLRGVGFQAAVALWTAVIAVGVPAALLAWLAPARWAAAGGAWVGLFVGLLIAQFPVAFAMERANNDVLVLLLWAGTLLLLRRRRPLAAGLVAGTAAALKIYPVVAAGVVFLGLATEAWHRAEARRDVVRFAAGGALAVAVALLLTFSQTRTWLAVQLPAFSRLRNPPLAYGHALHDLWPLWDGGVLKVLLLAAWSLAAVRLRRRDLGLLLAGGLAMCTYFASTSYDYNLITTFPLLLLLFLRVRSTGGWLELGLAALGIVAIAGHRLLFAGSAEAAVLHVALQWLWLVACAAAAPWLADPEASPAAA